VPKATLQAIPRPMLELMLEMMLQAMSEFKGQV
jgi:hypothetical protein